MFESHIKILRLAILISIMAGLSLRVFPQSSQPDDPAVKTTIKQAEPKIISVPRSAGEPHTLSFSPDGQTLAIGTRNGSVLLWTQDTEQLEVLGKHKGSFVMQVVFSPDSKKLVTGGYDKNAKLWDVKSRSLIADLPGHKDHVRSISFSPDGETVATFAPGNRKVFLWRTATGEKIITVPEKDDYYPPNPTGTLIGEILKEILKSQNPTAFDELDSLTEAQISSNGKTLGITTFFYVYLWDTAAKEIKKKLGQRGNTIYASAFSPDGESIAIASSDHWTTKIWNVSTGDLQMTLNGRKERIIDLVFSPDGKTLATVNNNQTAQMYDVASGKLRAELPANQGSVWNLIFSPDGEKIATASFNPKKSVKVWSAGDFRLLNTFNNNCYPMAFDNMGETLVTSDSKTNLSVWNLNGH